MNDIWQLYLMERIIQLWLLHVSASIPSRFIFGFYDKLVVLLRYPVPLEFLYVLSARTYNIMYNPSPKIKTSPKKGAFQKEVIFQASFFKGHVSFSGEYTYIYSIHTYTPENKRGFSKWCFGNGDSFQIWWFLVFMLNFWGVHILYPYTRYLFI